MARSCATRSRNSQTRNGGSSPPTSPTSTDRSSRWSTCRRRSRERSSPATPVTRGPSAGSISMSSPPTCRRADGPSRARRRASARPGVYGASSWATAMTRSRRSAAPTSHVRVGLPTCSPRCSQRGRLAAYLEQSTRYIPYDQPLPDSAGGGHRFYRDDELGPGVRRGDGGALRDLLAARSPRSGSGRRNAGRAATSPRRPGSARSRPRRLDLLRGLLPAATLSHVGIFASGQAYEQLLAPDARLPAPGGPALRDDDPRGAQEGDAELRGAGGAPRPRRGVGLLSGAAPRARPSAGSPDGARPSRGLRRPRASS